MAFSTQRHRPNGTLSEEERLAMRRQLSENIKRAQEEFGFKLPKHTIDFTSPEGLNIIHKLHCAGYSQSVMAAFLGSHRKTVQKYLSALRKEAAGDKLPNRYGEFHKQDIHGAKKADTNKRSGVSDRRTH